MQTIIKIKKLDINGYGIGYYKNKVVFVPKALPDEEVEVIFKEIKPKYINAELVEIKKYSADRVTPICQAYNKCGGCNLMHLDYQKQLNYKKEIVKESFRKYSDLKVKVLDTLPCDELYAYRTKVSLVVKKVKERVILGLYEENGHYVVDLHDCIVQDQEINKVLELIRQAIIDTNAYCGDKGLKYIVLRKSNFCSDMQLILVYGKKQNEKKLVQELSKIPNLKNIYLNINPKNRGPILANSSQKIYGNTKTIKNKLDDKFFKLSPNDFFQLNTKQTIKLYDVVKKYAKGSKSVVDCYCGVGSIGQYINPECLRGIEIIPSAVKNANENFKINNCKSDLLKPYVCGTVGEVLKRWAKDGYKPDLMIFDPPRVGLDDGTLTTILKTRPNKVIYVSCNPSTLAKDVDVLKEQYKVVKVQPVDMFCHTNHVECIALLQKEIS